MRMDWQAPPISESVVLGSFTSCNTIRGAGQDIEKAGDAVKDAADGKECGRLHKRAEIQDLEL